jgi:hypothetical protein
MTKNTEPTKLYTPDQNPPVENLVAALAAPVSEAPAETAAPFVCFSDVLIAAAENYLSLPCVSTEHSIARARLAECLAYLKVN